MSSGEERAGSVTTAPAAPTAPPRAPAGHFPCLDAYRGIGMVMVLLAHAYYTTRNPNASASGVGRILARFDVALPMFLVLSAFLLFRPYVQALLAGRPAMRTHRFYRHRFLRIFPGYWVALTIIVLALGVSFSSTRQALSFYSLLQVYGKAPVLLPQYQPIYQAWSLAAEVLFYFLLPPFALLLGRWCRGRSANQQVARILVAVGVAYAIGAGYRLMLVALQPSWERRGVLWFPCWLDMFAIGMALATIAAWSAHTRHLPEPIDWLSRHIAVCWALAWGLFLLVAAIQVPLNPLKINGHEYMIRQFCYGIFSALWLLPAMFGDQTRGRMRRVLSSRALVFGGTISLGFYLFHVFWLHQVEVWTGRTFFNADFWTLVAVALPLTLVTASLSYYIVERPFLRMKDGSPISAWRALVAGSR